MNAEFRNQLFRASAGTGKTYRLSAHFVGLLVRGVAPDRILATTFTRKAAGEILSRVLQRLVQVAEDDRAAAELAKNVGFPVRSEHARAVLPGLARQIHRFQVRTLDSHVSQVVRLFEAELRLPPGWSIIDEVSDLDLRDEALDEALQSEEEGIGAALLRGLDPTGERRGVFEHIRTQINELRAYALESTEPAWARNRVPEGLSRGAWEQAVHELERFEDLPLTQKKQPNQGYQKAHRALVELAKSEQWEAMISSGFFKKLLENDHVFNRVVMPESLLEVLDPVLRQIKHVLLGQAHDRNLASYHLIDRFERAYGQRKLELGWLRFDDLPRFLDPFAKNSPFGEENPFLLDDLWLRMDARIDHLLLDEFQDTSSVQWRTLATLVDEIASTHAGPEAGGRSLFCVGDVKQSIYGWRQGEAGLLPMLADRYHLDPEDLEDNYRSSPLIMDLCNRVFARLNTTSLATGDGAVGFARAAAAFQEDYREHRAKQTQYGGAAQAWRVQVPEGSDSALAKRWKTELAAARVAAIHAEAPHATIGVLFRARRSMAALLHRLQETYGLRASGQGGNPLIDAEAVSVVASCLHWLDHPGDVAAAFHVATSRLGAAWGLADLEWNHPEHVPGRHKALQRALTRIAARLRAEIGRRGLATWLVDVLPAVEAGYGAWDQQRFAQLIDHADAFQASDPLRPARWARLIRNERIATPWSVAIQVMTIHQSKGLEFDAVVLPDLDSAMVDTSKPSIAVVRPRPDLPYTRVSRLPKRDVRKLDPELVALAESDFADKYQEAINLLYVALTRAKHRLEFVIGPKPEKTSAARLLLEGLELPEPEALEAEGESASSPTPQRGIRVWEETYGDSWTPEEPSAEGPSAAPAGLTVAWDPSGSRSAPQRRTRTPSQAAQAQGHDSPTGAQCLQLGAQHTRGTLWHAWLETIEWWDGSSELVCPNRMGVAPERWEAWRSDFAQALRAPALQTLLRRPEGEIRAFRERRFWWTDPNEVLWTGSIDRVVVHFEEERPVAAHVIDFKTGYEGADMAAIVDGFRPQLEVYRQATAQQFGLSPDTIRMSLALLDRGEVVEVSAEVG